MAPVAVLAFAVMVARLRARDAVDLPRLVLSAVVCVYGAGVVAHTVLPIYLGKPGSGLPWTTALNLAPLVDTEPRDMLQNVVVFLPLGFLLPLVARIEAAVPVLLTGFVLSLTMELVQLGNTVTGHGGHVADVNDLLANTVGAGIGFALYRLVLRSRAGERARQAVAWPRH